MNVKYNERIINKTRLKYRVSKNIGNEKNEDEQKRTELYNNT